MNIPVNEELNVRTARQILEEKNINPSSYLPQKEPFKSSSIKDIKLSTTKPRLTREEFKAEEKLSN